MFRINGFKNQVTCLFCNRNSHFRADIYKFKDLLNSKSKLEVKSLAFINFEYHFVNVPLNSWWIDTEASTHATNLLQRFEQRPSPADADVINRERKFEMDRNCKIETFLWFFV